ncbi:MAG TPA: hypothetical protein VFC95_04065, partial [Guyparkeria sp.]|nr:hypothetical protein [Guyparkeria sp.]
MRKLSLVIAGVLGAGYPLISQTATLGQAQVQSYLSEPLRVHVPLMRASDEPLDEITVQLAPPSFYQQAGVPLADLGSNLTFAIRSEGGQEYVLIGSKRPIRDPILSILLQVDSPQGRMIRSYNLLLDPPSITTASAAVSTSGPATRTAPVDKPTGASAWQPVKPAEGISFEATRQIAQGDTLYKVAQDYVRQGEDVRSWMQAIIDANPQAFANGNGNLLMAGAELKVPRDKITDDQASGDGVPGDSVPGEASADEASKTESIVAQDGVKQTFPILPALELLSPLSETGAAADGLSDSDSQSLQAAAAEAKAALEAAEAKAALDQEELQSVKAENETLITQLLGLRDQVASIELAVDERDSRIAELKEAVEAAKATQDGFWVRWGKYLTGALGLLVLALLIALGLRRSRQDEGSSASMPAPPISPVPAGSKEQETPSHNVSDSATGTAVVAGAVAAGTVAAGLGHDEAETEEPDGATDPMSPEMALEEARVLESFNLMPQAIELLRENLAEHPDHAGLQAALDRLEGEERGDGDAVDKDFTDTEEPASEVEATDTSRVVIGDAEGDDIFTGADVEASVDESSQPQEFEETSESMSWDDDMLTISTTEPEREADDTLMEFDDSFALETPTEEHSLVESSADELPDTATTAHEAQEVVSEDDL